MRRRFILLSLLLLVATFTLHSQTVSIGSSYDYGPARLVFTSSDQTRYHSTFDTVRGSLLLRCGVAVQIDSTIALAVRMTGRRTAMTFVESIPEPAVIIPGGDGVMPSEERLSFTATTVAVELAAEWRIVERFRISAGPIIGFRTISNYVRSFYTDRDGWRYYVDDTGSSSREWVKRGTTDIADDGSNLDQHHLYIGALLGAGYEIPLTPALSIVPELHVTGDFTAPIAEASWSWMAGGIGLAVEWQP